MALIDVGEGDTLTRRLLAGISEAADLGTIIDVGRCHVRGLQMAERVDGHLQFRAAFALGAIVAGALAALRGRT